MNKLVFRLKKDWEDDVVLIANNHKDLQEYLDANYDWYCIDVREDYAVITERPGFESEVVTLEWVKHI